MTSKFDYSDPGTDSTYYDGISDPDFCIICGQSVSRENTDNAGLSSVQGHDPKFDKPYARQERDYLPYCSLQCAAEADADNRNDR